MHKINRGIINVANYWIISRKQYNFIELNLIKNRIELDIKQDELNKREK